MTQTDKPGTLIEPSRAVDVHVDPSTGRRWITDAEFSAWQEYADALKLALASAEQEVKRVQALHTGLMTEADRRVEAAEQRAQESAKVLQHCRTEFVTAGARLNQSLTRQKAPFSIDTLRAIERLDGLVKLVDAALAKDKP